MKISNETLLSIVTKAIIKHGAKTEKYYTALYNIWEKYNLTQEQCEFLETCKAWEE